MDPGDITRVSLRLASKPIPSLGLYVHVPFCRVRCPFCPFYLEIHRQRRVRQFLDALKREVGFYAGMREVQDVPVTTVYVGGGTPTTLTTSELGTLLKWIQDDFFLAEDAEISIEVHPGTVTGIDLKALRTAGFNRLSLGFQSFDGEELRRLGGRIYLERGYVTVGEARSAGFQNINLDLMYGFPGHSVRVWRNSLDKAIALSPEHLSCYAFTVEVGTRFHEEVCRGHVPMPEDNFQVVLEEEAIARLSGAGYERYEVSNFSREGYVCRHNTRYWEGKDYLGFGPSAQSYVGGVRFGNMADLEWYSGRLQESQLPLEMWDPLTLNSIEREEVVFGLRMMKGVPVSSLSNTLQSDEKWKRGIQDMQEKKFLKIEDGHLRLTTSGFQYADTVAVALL